jgi:hypothetical protein
MRRAPMGAKMIPMMRRVGRTVLGVRIGCQALSRCCLKAVSKWGVQEEKEEQARYQRRTGWSPPTAFLLLLLLVWRIRILSGTPCATEEAHDGEVMKMIRKGGEWM